MSDSPPQNDPSKNEPTEQDLLADGLDGGTGDPGDDRAYLMDTAPTQLDDEALREHADEEQTADERDAGE